MSRDRDEEKLNCIFGLVCIHSFVFIVAIFGALFCSGICFQCQFCGFYCHNIIITVALSYQDCIVSILLLLFLANYFVMAFVFSVSYVDCIVIIVIM